MFEVSRILTLFAGVAYIPDKFEPKTTENDTSGLDSVKKVFFLFFNVTLVFWSSYGQKYKYQVCEK